MAATASDASLADFVIDGVAPQVLSLTPADGSTGVSLGTTVVVRFSQPMNRESAEAALSLRRTDVGAYATGSFAWSGNDLTFTPSASLAGGVVYRAPGNATAQGARGPGAPPP